MNNKKTTQLNSNNHFVYIYGCSGCGKSYLATVLNKKITDSVLIDAGKSSQYEIGSLDITELLTSMEVTYIIDGIHYLNVASKKALEIHIEKRGKVIALGYSMFDLTEINHELVDVTIRLDKENHSQLHQFADSLFTKNRLLP
ncbi:hypothetical protein KEC58_22195 (plasmid) [Photobacterium damselae]|uniref:hypothetical protein n=1 Tax=Photobacterium damselae TaxID=38293 RepID=UPI0025430082